jgi:hypothetical protein
MANRTRAIDAVLPLLARDLERSKILLDSLRLFRDLGTLWVIARADEQAHLERSIGDGHIRFLSEEEVVPELKAYRWLHWVRNRGRSSISGWYVQQLAKMSMADRVDTDFYLTLDADVICMKPVGYDDLIANGRAINQRTREDRHPDWYRWAERVLGTPRSCFTHGVTPALLSREAMNDLHKHLEQRESAFARWAGGWLPVGAGALVGGWRAYLLRNLPWTEYSLYGTFLDTSGRYDRYHWDGGPSALYARSVWRPDAFASWDPRQLLDEPHSYFCVVQSTTKIEPAAIRAKLALMRQPQSSKLG